MARTDTRWYRHERWIANLARVLLIVGALWVLGVVLDRLATVLVPVFGGFLLAFFGLPAIDALARRMHRGLAVAVVALGFFIAMAALFLLVIPLFARELSIVLQQLPGWIDRIKSEWVPAVITTLELEDAVTAESLQSAIERMAAPVIRNTAFALTAVTGFLGRAVNVAVILVLVPVFAMFFGYHFHAVVGAARSLVPPRHLEHTTRVVGDIDRTLAKWVRGQLTVALALAVMYATGLSIAGLEGGVVIGIFAGLLNFIPYLGTAVGLTLSLLMAALEGSPPATYFIVLTTFGVAGLIEGWVITPRVVGGSTGLGGLGVLIALMVGGELMGMLGVLIAVPTAAIVVILVREAAAAYRDSAFYKHS